MNLKEQEYVCALAENGTITAAAKELFISQPALSIYINNLEKSLGVRLFERVGKGEGRRLGLQLGERFVRTLFGREEARAHLIACRCQLLLVGHAKIL